MHCLLQVYIRYIILISWPGKLIRWYLFESKYCNLILQFLIASISLHTNAHASEKNANDTSQRGLKLKTDEKRKGTTITLLSGEEDDEKVYFKKVMRAEGTVRDDLASRCGDGGGGRGVEGVWYLCDQSYLRPI